jgi:hypothetical protein
MKKYYEIEIDFEKENKNETIKSMNLSNTKDNLHSTKSKKNEYRKLNLESNTSIK